ncbi:hypothetical protein CEXT_633451 [Caerostris extrusa]|uniref:Uncharacterized protein n=1 Tax=Caerostris extrusa TaxID=172846 RepID=A0AAV4NYS6_CAEEX|nr:hypothetical protein CEXT_633451 [Caerostris extrusa]
MFFFSNSARSLIGGRGIECHHDDGDDDDVLGRDDPRRQLTNRRRDGWICGWHFFVPQVKKDGGKAKKNPYKVTLSGSLVIFKLDFSTL